jgi:hypothetical protein
MGIKKSLALLYARYTRSKVYRTAARPVETQQRVFDALISTASHTAFGREHDFSNIHSYEDFISRVPIREYEGFRPYIERIIQGEKDVLWKGTPLYFAKTSGTTSGAKYIPISRESMPTHIRAAKHALLMYIASTGKADFTEGKMIFLQGSPVLDEKGGIKTGRLSGIVAHYVPSYLQKNRLPSWETNCIEDWETKVDEIVEETLEEDMRLISGIPSWVQMYFERLIHKTGKTIGEIFPRFQLFVYGGVNFAPYKETFNRMIGREVDYVELYPASEGFIAYQDKPEAEGMLLITDGGIFYEFIPSDEFYSETPSRITLKEVKLGVNYVIILNTNAGLWGYNIGDTVEFTSLNPYRIRVTGRIKHFISAFGEHVIAKEVETAIDQAVTRTSLEVKEFTVAPQVNPKSGLPYHEWLIEFDTPPHDLKTFSAIIENSMNNQNAYYKDLTDGKILRSAVVTPLRKGAFNAYMKAHGKLGGQNKIPRL